METEFPFVQRKQGSTNIANVKLQSCLFFQWIVWFIEITFINWTLQSEAKYEEEKEQIQRKLMKEQQELLEKYRSREVSRKIKKFKQAVGINLL